MRTIASRGAVLASIVMSSTAASAGNMSLEIDALPAVQLSAFDTGASNVVVFSGGGGGGSGKVTFKAFGFKAPQSATTPALMRYVADGRHLQSARVQVRSTDGARLLSEWTLSDALVTSVEVVNGEADAKAKAGDIYMPPETAFSLVFSRYCYKVFAADGATIASQMCWDLATNTGS